MRLISHRGNLWGVDVENENKINKIRQCIEKGFEVEIDIRCEDNTLYLGHDKPGEKIDLKTIEELSDSLWIHCKTPATLNYMIKHSKFYNGKNIFNFFVHEKDPYTITSQGFIWTTPNSEILDLNCIQVCPENHFNLLDVKSIKNKISNKALGVCSDYIAMIRK